MGSAAAWGTGDFAGGLAARRAGGMLVTGGAQVVGFVLLLIAVLVLRPALPAPTTLVLGALGGIAGGLGLAALYRGLGMGAMGLVSAVSGVGGVLIPLAVGILAVGHRHPAAAAGRRRLRAASAIAAASGATTRGVSREGAAAGADRRPRLRALVRLPRSRAEQTSSGRWSRAVARRRSSSAAARSCAPTDRGCGAVAPLVGLAGLLDVAANGMVVLAFATIPVGIAAALSGTYPLATMILARTLLGEALPRLGLVAVALAVTGIVLISLGG